ncbi:ParB N-terminal domain-containing protein, partial [Candidatus Sumerlaeota bacterium]|nr:ParB N-terminal domain-containing protein [Candidatus Sumerlaeota bacterium]
MARPHPSDLVKEAAEQLAAPAQTGDVFGAGRPRPTMLRLADIEPDMTQPRIDLGDVGDLSASIREHGLIQPLVVSPIDGVKYRIIAGARRHEACRLAGLTIVPAIVRTDRDQRRLEIQLIENL